MPILVAAFFGFPLGSRILDPVYSMSAPRAALHGMGVALASYVVVACWYAANVSLTKYPPDYGFLLFAIIIGSSPSALSELTFGTAQQATTCAKRLRLEREPLVASIP
jgi:hypothetical protein